jgi:hypothetical protein
MELLRDLRIQGGKSDHATPVGGQHEPDEPVTEHTISVVQDDRLEVQLGGQFCILFQ